MSSRNELETTVSSAALRKMEAQIQDLRLLVEVSGLIGSKLEPDELMPLVMEKAKDVMEAEACAILLYNAVTNQLEFEVAMSGEDSAAELLKKTITLEMGQGIAGWVARERQPLFIDDVTKDDRFFRGADKATGFTTRSIIAVPLIGRRGLIGVAEIINPGNKGFDPEIFQLLCGQFAIAIENARFHRESIQRERLSQQLEIAASIQKSFLPESPAVTRGRATLTAVNISASQVGGDVYDFTEPVEGSLGFLIGDVSGKGITAALYMAKFISDFRFTSRDVASPEEALDILNGHASRAPMGMFLTGVYGIVDVATGALRLAVAGHPPFIQISRGEVAERALPAGPPLGIVPCSYPVNTLQLAEGDRLLFLTDGVFDAKNREGERLGFEAIVAFAREHRQDDDLVEKLVAFVNAFSRGAEQADDLTIVELRWGT